jgi:hypothetical protein
MPSVSPSTYGGLTAMAATSADNAWAGGFTSNSSHSDFTTM